MPYKIKNKNLLAIASKAKTTLYPGKILAIWNFIQEIRGYNNQVNKKPPNQVGN